MAPSPHGQQLPEPVPEPPPGLVDAVRGLVTAHLAGIAAHIPDGPAAVLGRLGAPAGPTDPFGPPPVQAGVDVLLAERLLGALEQAVENLTPDVSEVAQYVPVRPEGGAVAILSSTGGGAAATAARALDQLAPGVRGLVAGLVAALVAHDEVAALLAVPPGTEPQAAAAHGRAHLALAVVAARAVLLAARPPVVGAGAPAVVGAALDAAARVLRERRLPPAYEAALLGRRRAEYRLPRVGVGRVPVSGHRFALVEGGFPDHPGEPANGLVQVVPGGLVVRTGTADGPVRVTLRVLAEEPGEMDLGSWHEVVDVSYTAIEGAASLLGPHAPGDPHLLERTPPWPGPVRARVCAHGRDEESMQEHYEIALWSASPAPDVVHRATDRLGHRLRGEPEPPAVVRPEAAYRWVRDSTLGVAATVTVATGASPEEVLAAFGADPAAPVSMPALFEQPGIDPWVAVLPVDGDTGPAVLAVEYNGWQGAQSPVLRPASAAGRAASMYWNVDALTNLAFARTGTVLASFEPPPHERPGDAEVLAALDGLDLDDHHDRVEKGLAAVERFTGRGLRPEDVERIEAAGVAYRILPRLPELYPVERLPDGSRRWSGPNPLGPDTELLVGWPEPELRDLAWWVAAEVARHAGLDALPEVAESLARRELTPGAELQARATGLEGRHQHRQAWLTLHEATNPDPPAAAIGALESARYALGPHAADFLDLVRARIPRA
jgi:hypothetical protein